MKNKCRAKYERLAKMLDFNNLLNLLIICWDTVGRDVLFKTEGANVIDIKHLYMWVQLHVWSGYWHQTYCHMV